MSYKHWTAVEIRKQFLNFFKEKEHEIVSSAPLVLKDDPTLLFTNSGMNQFKDYFLDYKKPTHHRIADTQKCLRVSGKHNDLEEVGLDTYHHTFFEMLGNWSFGNYFKKEAIEWGWELLTEVYGIPKDQIYVTIFEGDKKDGLDRDHEAYDFWKGLIAEDRIINGNKKDNFWEMGETGPCGPCSEIHVDIRPKADRASTDGKSLVNHDHPQVVEIWNLVFMQYNRKADGSLEKLAKNHIDTGMGFERLCMVLQGKESNYDTDVFTNLLQRIESFNGLKYGGTMSQQDIAFRVIADHVRAVSFAIADGQLPSNTGAGYVIRRILRRAVRYGYSFLDLKEAFLYQLVQTLADDMGGAFPELSKQSEFIQKVIQEEENSFLRTLSNGLQKLESVTENLSGKQAFELYDTYGFPLDLTLLIAKEKGLTVDEDGFKAEMAKQKDRSRSDAKMTTGDWTILSEETSSFIGYDHSQATTKILRHRTVNQKGKDIHQIVLKESPFYAESGGQVGDQGTLAVDGNQVYVFDTKKENDLTILFTKDDISPLLNSEVVIATINQAKRKKIENNHSATHLLHAALRSILGNHVEQKGSLVNAEKLRFDFSHFGKMTDEELEQVEELVNQKIAEGIQLEEDRNASFKEATQKGAMALFGEKYGDTVRVITFDSDYSVELCGGCHVKNTANIRLFKIASETAISAGVRRIEAITGHAAIQYYKKEEATLNELKVFLKNAKDPIKVVEQLMVDNQKLTKQLDSFSQAKGKKIKQDLLDQVQEMGDINFIGEVVEINDANVLKNLAFELKNEIDNLVLILGAEVNQKANLSIMISENLVSEKNLNASVMIRELSKAIEGGGGGQSYYATAGGKKVDGLSTAVAMGRSLLDALN